MSSLTTANVMVLKWTSEGQHQFLLRYLVVVVYSFIIRVVSVVSSLALVQKNLGQPAERQMP